MTVSTGMRQRAISQRYSSPSGSTRAEQPVASIELGGTGAATKPDARAKLEVPGLNTDNVFTGDNTFAQPVVMSQAETALIGTDSTLTLQTVDTVLVDGGAVVATLDLTGMTDDRLFTFPDASGTLLVDAPSDGKYYARKDGAWVEIVP